MSTQRVIPQTWRGTLSRCLILAGAIVGVFAVGPASAAHAGTYHVTECDSGAGVTTAADAAYASNTGSYTAFTDCSNTRAAVNPSDGVGAYANTNFGCACTQYADTLWQAPPTTTITTLTFDFRIASVGGHQALIEMGAPGGLVALWNSTGYPDPNQYYTYATESTNATYLEGYVACAGTCTNVGDYNLRNLDFTLDDTGSPTIGLSGSLVGSGTQHGTEDLVVNGGDQGSGINKTTVAVNGVSVGTSGSNCSLNNSGGGAAFSPCPKTTSRDFSIDTAAPPWRDGDNTVHACVTDFAQSPSQPNTTCADRTVTIDNSCDDAAGEAQANALDANLAEPSGQLTARAAVTSNDSVPVEGHLSGAGGAVAGAPVCVYEQVDAPDQDRQLVETAKTKQNGDFAITLPAGPSRDLDVVYRYNNQLIEKQLSVDSTAVPTLAIQKKKIRNGQNMKFSGSIPAVDADQRGVTVQAKIGKRSWRTFKQLKTDEHGQFKGRYRFKASTVARARYTFRVLVKQQNGYPYEPGTSAKKKIIVLG